MPINIQAPCQLQFSAKNEWEMTGLDRRLVEFPTKSWEFAPRELPAPLGAIQLNEQPRGRVMLGKLVGAMIGEKIAGRNKGAKGALLGAGAAAVARRGFGPLAGVLALGWGAKKLYEWRKGRSPSFPKDATPS
jgi:hypothetical protein